MASENYFCKEVFCNNFGRDGTKGKREGLGPLGNITSCQVQWYHVVAF